MFFSWIDTSKPSGSELTLFGMEKIEKRLRKYQSSNIKKCEVFPVPDMLIILGRKNFSV